jgi:hypothetical protein
MSAGDDVAGALAQLAAAIRELDGATTHSPEVRDALLEIADNLGHLGSRRAALDHYVAAVLGALGPGVGPQRAASIAWGRAIAAMRWADEHRAEVQAASRYPFKWGDADGVPG